MKKPHHSFCISKNILPTPFAALPKPKFIRSSSVIRANDMNNPLQEIPSKKVLKSPGFIFPRHAASRNELCDTRLDILLQYSEQSPRFVALPNRIVPKKSSLANC